MDNLEQEFQKLMDEIVSQVIDKCSRGEISYQERDDLIHVIATRRYQNTPESGSGPDATRYGKECPDGHDDPDCGWSPSMGYHCT